MLIAPKEGWFGQPKYSTHIKKIILRYVGSASILVTTRAAPPPTSIFISSLQNHYFFFILVCLEDWFCISLRSLFFLAPVTCSVYCYQEERYRVSRLKWRLGSGGRIAPVFPSLQLLHRNARWYTNGTLSPMRNLKSIVDEIISALLTSSNSRRWSRFS